MIIFDTETSGLIDNIAQPLKQQPRIIELFALKIDDAEIKALADGHAGDIPTPDWIASMEKHGQAHRWQSLFRVKGITEEITGITHITQEMLDSAPLFIDQIDSLSAFFSGEKYLVGHNLSFDRDILWLELRRLSRQCQFPWPWVHIDTVEQTEAREGYRLSLGDLHTLLFGAGFTDAHRAESDTMATARCVVELIRRKEIRL